MLFVNNYYFDPYHCKSMTYKIMGKIIKSAAVLGMFLGIFSGAIAQTTLELPAESDQSTDYISPGGVFTVSPVTDMVEGEEQIRAGLLYDVEKDVVVWEKNMHFSYPIASLTKMMVALLAAEDVANCKAEWTDEVKVQRSYRASRRSKKIYHTTETYTLESLVQLALIPSNNLACGDIGSFLEGNVDKFVERMNVKAKSLGMNNTFYSNPSGLPATYSKYDNHSSPHDLLLLALELIKNEDLMKVTSVGYVEVDNGKSSAVHRNHNRLVIDYENQVDGLKTGYTKRARYCLTATANKDDYRIISIVLGVSGPYLRNELVATMMNRYYNHIGCGAMAKTNEPPLLQKSVLTTDQGDDGTVAYRLVWTKEKKSHIVRSGETLSEIGSRYRVPYSSIKRWNGLRSDRIYSGQRLYVYVSTQKRIAVKENDNEAEENDEGGDQIEVAENKTTDTADKTPVKTADVKPKSVNPLEQALKSYDVYVVQPGDTLWNIAQKYTGISAEDIRRTNNIRTPKALQPGTKLKIKKQG